MPAPTDRPRVRWAHRWGFWAAVLCSCVLVAGLAATAVATDRGNALQRRVLTHELDRYAVAAQATLEGQIHRYIDQAATLAAGLTAQAELTGTGFTTATEPLASARLPGVSGVAFIVPATDADAPAVQAYWRGRGSTGLTLAPSGTGREHMYTVFARSLDGVASQPGADLASLAEPAQALNEARRSATVAVSNTYVLLKDRHLPAAQRRPSFAFAAPVYAPGTVVAGLPRPFRGWLLLGLRASDFVTGALRELTRDRVRGELFAPSDDGEPVPVASYGPPAAGARAVSTEVWVAVAQHRWRLRLSTLPRLLAGDRPDLVPLLTAGGLAGTGLLALAVFGLFAGTVGARCRLRAATSELRGSDRRARRRAALLEAALNSASDGVGLVDGQGRFLLHNPAARRLLAVDTDPDDPAHWTSHYGIFRPDGTTPFPVEELPLALALRGQSTDGVEMVIRNPRRPAGIRISVSGRPLDPAAGQPGAVSFFRDVTAERAQRAELAAFAGVVAHDLKSPLAAVSGVVGVLDGELADLPTARQARALTARITTGLERMGRLIDDLLSYAMARDAPLHPVGTDLHRLVSELVEERLAEARDQDDRPVPDIYLGGLPVVYGDPVLLRQLFDNLIGNALKYSPPGQRPRVDITVHDSRERMVRIAVADRGIGIPQGQHLVIFDGFHRASTAAQFAGTGLGLAICRRIMDRHGGVISAADREGGGAVFTVTLSLPPDPAPLPPDPTGPPPGSTSPTPEPGHPPPGSTGPTPEPGHPPPGSTGPPPGPGHPPPAAGPGPPPAPGAAQATTSEELRSTEPAGDCP